MLPEKKIPSVLIIKIVEHRHLFLPINLIQRKIGEAKVHQNQNLDLHVPLDKLKLLRSFKYITLTIRPLAFVKQKACLMVHVVLSKV